MPCPFPGMDPYIERTEIWPDFHDRLITHVCGVLQPLLRPRYVALTQDRLYVVESERAIRPDLSILRTHAPPSPPGPRAATLELDTPAVFELVREEIREPRIHIVEPAAGNRVVTALEVLSPDNKAPGPGRSAYLQKREELWLAGANLVELDLWSGGAPTLRISPERLEGLRPWRYLVAVTRVSPPRQEVYPIPLEHRLPCVAIPLAGDDPDVALDLAAAFRRCWEEGPYPELLRYDGPPPATITSEQAAWCAERLGAAGLAAGPART
ncbi:MAG: DUF4058 family protein [Planctomycetes bacterium]|nr:DUF4058 family protein [Planctomycetota bacterium]